MAKKFIQEIDIVDFAFPNKGIGYIDGKVMEVKCTIPGQRVSALVHKKKDKYCGQILEVISTSYHRMPHCQEMDRCGGCTFQGAGYEYEEEIKHKMIQSLFQKAGIMLPAPIDFVKHTTYEHYRNKMEYSFGDNEKDGVLSLGMKKRGTYYEVIDGSKCEIAPVDFSKIVECVVNFFRENHIQFYHKGTREGFLRHLVLREGFFTKEIMVNLVTVSGMDCDLSRLVNELMTLELTSKIVSIFHSENDGVADIVKADHLHLLYGREYINEEINGLKFKISPFSFFQTNSAGSEILYNTVKEFAGDDNKHIFDLYCGTGTIGQILSENAEHVIGIEIVEEAVKSARENSVINNISNIEFICGDVLLKIKEVKGNPDLIILDPPRDGIHPKAIMDILNFGAKKIVYISCKPTSLMEDLNVILNEGYSIERVRVHDMFPRSYHIETVVLMTRAS